MTEEASKVIYDAFQMIGIQPAEEDIDAEMATQALRVLNNMMHTFETAKGIDLDFTTLTGIDEDVTVDDAALEGVKANLAVRLWPLYIKEPVSQLIMGLANNGYKDLLKIGQAITEIEYPDTLPKGSGNESYSYATEHFYDGVDTE